MGPDAAHLRTDTMITAPRGFRRAAVQAGLVSACLLWALPAAAADGNYYRLPAITWTDGAELAAAGPPMASSEGGSLPAPFISAAHPGLTWTVTPQDGQPPPEPPRTGLSALFRTTGADFKAFPTRKATWIILAIGGAAAAAVHPADHEIVEGLEDSSARKFFAPGRVLGYGWVQASAAIGVYAWGRTTFEPGEGRTNKISHLGFDLLRANILTQALTYGVKVAVQRDRPTGECCSFPSGHASVAFATASVLERHFGYRGAWPTFVIAGYVAASRLFDNRHYLSDVLFGSALGIASGWTVVGRHGRDQFALIPVPTRGGMAVTVQWRPASPATLASR
jgi:membrane-associated phospholipid phosphatase